MTYANAGATGTGTDSAAAHTMVIVTNATSGYTLTYNGATLTSGANTILVASSAGTGGTPGSEQFGMSTVLTGTGTVTAAYNHATPLWTWVASTTTTLASSTGPTTSSSFDMRYLANIAGTTEAGAYSTTVTYLATGNF